MAKVTRRKRCEHCGDLPAKLCDNYALCGSLSDLHEFDPYTHEISGSEVCVDYCVSCHNDSVAEI